MEGERYLGTAFPAMGLGAQLKLCNLSSFIAIPVFLAFIRSLFPADVPRRVDLALGSIAGALAAVVLVTPARIYSYLIPVFELVALVTCVFVLVLLVRATTRRREGSRAFAIGFAVLALAVINDVLFDMGLLPTGQLTAVGLFAFIVSQSFVLSRRFATAMATVEDQRQALLRSNRAHADEIEERKETQKALRASEERYRGLVENVPDLIYTIDAEGNFLAVNEFTLELLGHERHDLLGKSFTNVVHPEDVEKVVRQFLDTVDGGDRRPRDFRFRLRDKGGETIWVSLNASASFDANGIFVQEHGVARDITEEKRLEARLIQAQRMEAIGSLAGGIAHDFNNLLMAIQGNSSLTLLTLEPGHPGYEKLLNISTCVEDGSTLTRQLLGLSEGGKYDPKPTDLAEIVAKTARIFASTHKQIRIHESYADELWSVEVDRGQMEQVLLNLMVNAWQAMPDGGDLYLEVADVRLAERDALLFQLEPGRYVELAVTDTGAGMDAETRRRCFDPFFTTKDKGRGTGLGLASVYGIVNNHGGCVNVYSEPGEGTSFKLFFPASRRAVLPVEQTAETYALGEETILLVDDEPMILEVTADMLDAMGYTVISATSGPQALTLYEQHQSVIDLVILDIVMPDMSGSETFDRLQSLDPDVKVLLSSGYSIDGEAKAILDRGCAGFIQKPFRLEGLSQKIRKVLAG